ncbi:hypothetical protein [Gordonia hongkongensis]|uniref:hypothetical protein n=1 Tax=Gordonia hongkongensis TaxID=1701090 RepID=UPI003D7650BF
MANQYIGRHRLEHGGETVATIIRRATFTGPEWLVKILAWPNPFLAPTMPAVAPGSVKAERQGRNSFGGGR